MLTRRAGKWLFPSKPSDVVKRFGFILGVALVLMAASPAIPKNHQEWARYEARLRPVSSAEGETVAGHVI